MTDLLLTLVIDYGLIILAGTIFLAALGAPVPGTILLVLCGAFAASGDMAFVPVVVTALASAITGDLCGYLLGRKGGAVLQRRLQRSGLAKQVHQAERFMAKWGGAGVFLSRWLVAPLGPALNYVAGISGFSLTRFLFWDSFGEMIWVALYVGIGVAFSASAIALAELIASASWMIIGALAVFFTGRRLLKIVKQAGKPGT